MLTKIGLDGHMPYDINEFNISDFNYFNVHISILYVSSNFSYFQQSILRLHELCNDPQHVEILIMLYIEADTIDKYILLLSSLKFKWKIIVCKYQDINISYNDLAKLSFGKFIWLLHDYAYVDTQNWDSTILSYDSDKFVYNVLGHNYKKTRICVDYFVPIVTQKFYEKLEVISASTEYGNFLYQISEHSNKYKIVNDIFVQNICPDRKRDVFTPLRPSVIKSFVRQLGR